MTRTLLLGAGLALGWLGAVAVAEGAPREPALLARAAARPLLLPVLWSSLAATAHEGSPAAYAAQGRWLLDLLPRWTDGHIHFAAKLAFDASLQADGPERAFALLLAGLDLLEQALPRDPDGADRLLGAMASLVAIRTEQDPQLAELWRARFDQDPSDAADALLARAIEALPPQDVARVLLGERRAWLSLRLIAGALRTGDRVRARALVDEARRRFAAARDAANAAEWLASLALVARALDGDPTLDPALLRADPRLQDLVPLLAPR